MIRILIAAIAVSALAMTAGWSHAQHHQPKHGAHQALPSQTMAGPFGVAVHGAFRDMMRYKDHSPKVGLGTVIHGGSTEAVGALSDLRGEITFIEGKPIVSYGAPCADCAPPHAEKATLLIAAKVSSWRPPMEIPENLAGHELDRFIIRQANAAGLDMSKPFPVRLSGRLTNVAMHVIKAPNPKFGGHGSGQPMGLQEDIKTDAIEGIVVGIYAPEPMLGVITHPGEPFHFHWVDSARTRTAHLDAFGMAKGAQLLLPMN